MTKLAQFQSILITGASSGIGEALARDYANPGINLFLSGRNRQRLDMVAEACRAKGAAVDARDLDVRSKEAMAGWISEVDRSSPLDLIVANAAIAAGQGNARNFEDQSREIIDTNLSGVLNTVMPALDVMTPRLRGQIGIVSSLTGFYGLSSTPAYSASKAAVRTLGEGLRGRYAGKGIGISVICPGHVRSRMSADNKFPMLFLMDADRASRIIRKGLARNKARVTFPMPLALAIWMLNAMPAALAHQITKNLPHKE